MAATVKIVRSTGAGPGTDEIDTINTRANATDGHSTADTASPIQIPTDATDKYSYWVDTVIFATVAPATSIDNVEWYTDGSNTFGTGVTCVGNSSTSYVQATGTAGDTGLQLTTGNHAGLTAAQTDVFAFVTGSPKTLTGSLGAATGSGTIHE